MQISKVEARTIRTPSSGSFRTAYGQIPAYQSTRESVMDARGCRVGVEDWCNSLIEG